MSMTRPCPEHPRDVTRAGFTLLEILIALNSVGADTVRITAAGRIYRAY